MVPNDEPKSVNIYKISTALHVYYLNLIVNYLNTVQIAQIQAYNFECTPCSDTISGPMNQVFDIKSGHDFGRYRNSIQIIYFQINGYYPNTKICCGKKPKYQRKFDFNRVLANSFYTSVLRLLPSLQS